MPSRVEEAVQRVRRGVARTAVIEDEHRPPAAAEHQGGAQTRRAGADDDDITRRRLELRTARSSGQERYNQWLATSQAVRPTPLGTGVAGWSAVTGPHAAIAAKRGSPRSDSRSGSRRTRAAVSAGRRAATRSSESRARSRIAAQRVQAGDVVAGERIVGALGDAASNSLARAVEVTGRFLRPALAVIGRAHLDGELDAGAIFQRVIARSRRRPARARTRGCASS